MVLIKGYLHHYVDEQGHIYSDMSGKLKEMATFSGKNSSYRMIKIQENGIKSTFLVHRLVAEAFIPNPNGYSEINHIDYDKTNNNVDNLEWCTRLYNIHHSLQNSSPVKNHRNCVLYKGETEIGSFESVLSAAKYADENFHSVNLASLKKNLISGEFQIVRTDVDEFRIANHKTQNRNPSSVYYNGILIQTFDTFDKAQRFAREEYGVWYSRKWINKRTQNGVLILRDN